jgi:hypothetical protein
MAQVIPLRIHTFRIDNCIIDDYAAEIGPALLVYTVLQRYADRATGQCWPSIATIAGKLGISTNSVRKHVQHLATLGLISIATRSTPARKHTSHLYTVHDPTQGEAVQRRRAARRCQAHPADSAVPHTANPEVGGTAKFAVHTANPEVGGTAKFADEQSSSLEQETLISVLTPQMVGKPCDNPGHNHSSPFPGLQMCIECFRHWPVPLRTSPTAEDTERHQHA